ncbi:MAG TPA: inorganic diphosphatase [Candidatus Peribacteraceae bacterium]|nr:inorganic diphosphatase [Candidatus Peribacteraceae bacterium]
MNLDHIPAGKNIPDSVNVIVEIPKGSQNKYEFDKELNVLKLDRVLFSSTIYPGDYGFIPQTLASDGDPLDALVFVTNPTFPGTLIEVRPIGVLTMIDQGQGDDKLLCVPVHDVRFNSLKDIQDVEEPFLNEIAHFFAVYKELEGKKVEILGWKNAAAAKEIIKEAVAAYKG